MRFWNKTSDLVNLVLCICAKDGVITQVEEETTFKLLHAFTSKSNDLNYKYGTFDLQIRNFYDTDSEPEILEKYLNLSLDPSHDRYIARVIGDQNTYFDFNQDGYPIVADLKLINFKWRIYRIYLPIDLIVSKN